MDERLIDNLLIDTVEELAMRETYLDEGLWLPYKYNHFGLVPRSLAAEHYYTLWLITGKRAINEFWKDKGNNLKYYNNEE